MKARGRLPKLLLPALLLGLLLLQSACTPSPVYNRRRASGAPSGLVARGGSPPQQAGAFRRGQVLEGDASYYGPKFHGRLTANGEVFDQHGISCAHKTLPFDTVLEVTFLPTGKTVVVRVNDRGPFIKGRILDLSLGAAKRVGMVELGTGPVEARIRKLGGE